MNTYVLNPTIRGTLVAEYTFRKPISNSRSANKVLFNSMAFAVFLPIVFILYWALPHKFRWILLLAANYYFYMSWNAKYVLLLLFTTVVSYFAARLLEKEENKKEKKWILSGTLILCLGVLFFFKYFNLVSESIASMLCLFTIKMDPLTLDLLMPLGISFYTFQTLSYVIDVYKGNISAEHHFGYYAAFISFFPSVSCGPIERAENLLPQIKAIHKFRYDQATYGLKLMAWGFFKKIVIADTLSLYVNAVYDAPQDFQGFALVLASVFFTFQIYCDFSGYSDIAIGTAKLMGINMMTNFKSPYFSQSVKEFWRRWHISLSTWFRDYVYIPLGGNRVSKSRHAFSLIITFLVSGLWHGANWTFIVWGGVHGAAQVIESAVIPKEKLKSTGILKWLRILVVFVFCVFAWIFFISNSIRESFYVIFHLFTGIGSPISYLHDGFTNIGMGKSSLLEVVFCILLLVIFDIISLNKDVIQIISNQSVIIRWTIYIVFMLIVIFLSQKGIAAEFVYLQF